MKTRSRRRFIVGSGEGFQFLSNNLNSSFHFFPTKEETYQEFQVKAENGNVHLFHKETAFLGTFQQKRGDCVWIVTDNKEELEFLCQKALKDLPFPKQVFVFSRLFNASKNGIKSILEKYPFHFKSHDQLYISFDEDQIPSQIRIDRFEELLSKIPTEEKGAIVIDPDPDAIASALALRTLGRKQNRNLEIVSVSSVDRPENRQLLRYLGLNRKGEIIYLNGDEKFHNFDHKFYGVIDAQPWFTTIQPYLSETIPLRFVIDHHVTKKDKIPKRGLFIDIRPKVGSCSSILFEYLQAGNIKIPKRLKLALYYGIKTDTHNFSRNYSTTDHYAVFELSQNIDRENLTAIESKKVPMGIRNQLSKAFLEMTPIPKKNGCYYVFLGDVTEYPDILPTASDLLMSYFGMPLVCVGGIKKENDLWFLDLCARGIQDRPHLGRFMKKYVDGGGHAQMARGCLPLKNGYGEEKIKSNLESLLSKLPKVPH